MKLRLNISPCPNDTFMFDAMLNGRIDTCGLCFDVRFADIEELNAEALSGTADVSKISYALYPAVRNLYRILPSGSALGRGNGPVLVAARKGARIDSHTHLAVPGLHTTAHLLVRKLYPEVEHISPLLFSDIARAVASGQFDAGVLIHEGRFTYANHGLSLVSDLGREWEQSTELPLPLGAIVASRRLPEDVQRTVGDVLRRSIEYAFAHPDSSRDFILAHAQELSRSVVDEHVRLFVNDFSLDLGELGRRAVERLVGLESGDWV